MKSKAMKQIFLDTLPVLTGYLFLGIGFGILLAEQTGMGALWAGLMGVFVFAGSAQYLTVELLKNGTDLVSVAIAIFLVNARHIFYGISMIDAYKNTGLKKLYLIFGLTDETYSLVTQKCPPAGMQRHTYCLLVTVLDHLYWVVGCLLGSLVRNFIPVSFEGIEFVLTALFVTLFVEQWLSNKNHLSALIGVGCTAVCLAVVGRDYFLIPSMVLIAGLLLLTRCVRRKHHEA